ncbi:hypothetical protein ILUMI_26515 [Ignelater luminosus]|uniref:Uncharacterized protein n=1 Tax=Ignelater luminosus TaxID=2038154 RepID=A0A8K0C494_IGNLU|nr:hypothetical protein ILUMI_26515 [Ignelater luminosus]
MEFNKPSILNVSDNLAENFKNFKSEIDVYFVASETGEKLNDVQVARVINLMGPETLKLYKTITKIKPKNETVAAILDQLQTHSTPKTNETMEIYNFFNRKQALNKPFHTFYTDLKRLMQSCDFQDQGDKIPKVQIVLGINSTSVQQKLLSNNFSLEKTVECRKLIEVAEHNLRTLLGKYYRRNVKFIKTDGNAVDLEISEDNKDECVPQDTRLILKKKVKYQKIVKSDDASNVVLRKSERIQRPPNRLDL